MIYRVRILLARAWSVKRNVKSWEDKQSTSGFRLQTSGRKPEAGSLQPITLQLEVTDISHVVAVPHVSVVNAGAVDDGIFFRELNFFDNLAGLHVVPEEREQIGIAHPERVA